MTSVEVLIVGAGPSGLTAAVELALRKIRVRIIDMVPPRPSVESRALGTNARSQEIFERNGSLKRMSAIGIATESSSMWSRKGLIARFRMDGLDGAHPAMLALRQAETEQALIERLEELGVVVDRPVSLSAFQQGSDGVTVTLISADGRSEEVKALYMIAADGARSTVRKGLGLDFPGQLTNQREYLADVKVEWRGKTKQHLANVQHDALLFMGPAGSISFVPLAAARWRVLIFAKPGDPRFEEDQPSIELLQRLIDENGEVDARIYDLTWVSSFNQSARKIEKLRHDRIFFIGDAGHIHSPFGGQGMNTGVSDAANLCWKLALRLRGFGHETLLDSYHDERNPIIEKLMKVVSKGAPATVGAAGAAKSQMRAPIMRLVSRISPLRVIAARWMAGYLNHYRGSPIVTDSLNPAARRRNLGPIEKLRDLLGSSEIRPGDRAPDAAGLVVEKQKRRLFELWAGDPRHQLLLLPPFGTEGPSSDSLLNVANSVTARYASLVRPWLIEHASGASGINVIADSEMNLFRRYGGKTARLYIVRPDGYIGFRGDPSDRTSLQSYLDCLFGKNA